MWYQESICPLRVKQLHEGVFPKKRLRLKKVWWNSTLVEKFTIQLNLCLKQYCWDRGRYWIKEVIALGMVIHWTILTLGLGAYIELDNFYYTQLACSPHKGRFLELKTQSHITQPRSYVMSCTVKGHLLSSLQGWLWSGSWSWSGVGVVRHAIESQLYEIPRMFACEECIMCVTSRHYMDE